MQRLGRHCISSQSSKLWKDARSDQSMPHRRSSDVAAAVWLICEETIYPDIISQSIMALTNPSAMSRLAVTADQTRNACTRLAGKASQAGKSTHLPERSHRLPHCGKLFPWFPCLRVHNLCHCGGEMLQLASVSHRPSLPHPLGEGRRALPSQCSSTDRLCLTFVVFGLTLGIKHCK